MPVANLSVGDVVFITLSGHHFSNKTGSVKHISTSGDIGVEFNEDIPGLSNLNGMLLTNRGYWFTAKQLLKMQPLSTILKTQRAKEKKYKLRTSEPVFIIEEDQ